MSSEEARPQPWNQQSIVPQPHPVLSRWATADLSKARQFQSHRAEGPWQGHLKAIQDGLSLLRNTVPSGSTNMYEGLELANEQIEQERYAGNTDPVTIIALTDGTLLLQAHEESKREAAKSRQLGAVVYGVGVNDYNREQLVQIADSKNHVFGVDTGFKDLVKISDSLSRISCFEITDAIPSTLCATGPGR
ncbi:hypothetical protein QTO34_006270 [Cnephaeus nilssonii]|uniref:VWFA domain-containing protein n=1 Tax=Cnephaeus nilssonii TaxID=3371016 RepID=A0AA40HMB6_CNENI|nr:hypothetical protein QTO34_006270 [Eptesicus nilssonii]